MAECHGSINIRKAISRESNHPDFVGIIPILLENPESRPICHRDRKKSRFRLVVIFLSNSHKRKQNAEYLSLMRPKKLNKLQEILSEIVVLEHLKWHFRAFLWHFFEIFPSMSFILLLQYWYYKASAILKWA